MFKTIGILAHVDAGKTTLSEQILYRCGAVRSLGKVDRGDTVLDHDPTERRRGITIFSDQAVFRYADSVITLVDTPGHADFSPEMERTLSVLDCAVVVVSCVEGVQPHTETIWSLLEAYHVPTMFFLNKTDRVGADVSRTLSQIRTLCSEDTILLDDGINECAEFVAERDETLLESYLDTGYDAVLWMKTASCMTAQRRLFPAFSGSALSGDGVDRLLRGIDKLVMPQYDLCAPFSARVYKVRHDDAGAPITFLKVFSGTLRNKEIILDEKVNEIRLYNGGRFCSVQQAQAGQLCAVTGIHLPVGTCIGDGVSSVPPKLTPLLSSSVVFDSSIPVQNVLRMLRILEAEEPQMSVFWQESAQQIQIRVMGEIQLEVLAEQCHERFGIPISFGTCEVLYQETIEESVVGCGHYEPLRHYAEVQLLLRPLPRGSGVRFRSACPTDELKLNWQRLIETHVFEKTHRGALCGFPVTDIEVVLLTGRAHEKHTEGGDFRQATYRAIRQGLFRTHSVLLEPFYHFQIRVPSECIGRVLSDLEKMSAVYDAPESECDGVRVCGRCPASELMDYKTTLASFSKGRGTMRLTFDGYDRCHNADAVIESHPYNRDADYENTADSVFCAHGAGYNVRWDCASKKMHCTVDRKRLNAYTDDNQIKEE